MEVKRDIKISLKRWGVWFRLGLSDTVSKYRRSILGPLWLTLGMGITVAGIGSFWTIIWGVELKTFFPYFTAGLLIWNFIVGCLIEGSFCFVSQSQVIRAAPNPLFLYPLRLAVKLSITFAHNFIVYLIVAIIFRVQLNVYSLLIIPGIFLLFLFAVGTSLLFGIIGSRFRDFPPTIEAIVPLFFFITPVIWFNDVLGSRAILSTLNPFSHLIDILRKPMLGQNPTLTNYAFTISTIFIIWLLGFKLFSKYRNKITLWI